MQDIPLCSHALLVVCIETIQSKDKKKTCMAIFVHSPFIDVQYGVRSQLWLVTKSGLQEQISAVCGKFGLVRVLVKEHAKGGCTYLLNTL